MKIIIIYLSFIFDLCKNPSNICSGGNIIQYDLFWLLVALRRNMGFLTWQSIVFNQQTIEEEGDFLEANFCRFGRWLKKSFRVLMTHIFASHSSKSRGKKRRKKVPKLSPYFNHHEKSFQMNLEICSTRTFFFLVTARWFWESRGKKNIFNELENFRRLLKMFFTDISCSKRRTLGFKMADYHKLGWNVL